MGKVRVHRHQDIVAVEKGIFDRQLVRGVDAVDIEGGIGLGIALGLRFRQDGAEIRAALFHIGQDEIAGAVENARDALDRVRRGPLAQSLHDRNTARDRRFELERAATDR